MPAKTLKPKVSAPPPSTAKRASTTLATSTEPIYKRIMLKLSGESFQGPQGFGIHGETIQAIARELKDVHALGVEVAIMVGGGNIFRGTRQKGFDRSRHRRLHGHARHRNKRSGVAGRPRKRRRAHSRAKRHRDAPGIRAFIRRRAIRHLEKGRIVIFAAGIGNPYFSTDTAAALRAMEIKADVILKATRVDGIYDADPELVKTAKLYSEVTYRDVLHKNLKVMDATAISLCMDNGMPIVVFNMNNHGNIQRVLLGERVGSTVIPA